MFFADIHTHALFGVDDGAKTEKDMLAMVKAEFEDGIRLMCLTPHFHPGYYGDNRAAVRSAFETLLHYAEDELPDLELCLGNELHYSQDCVSWLRNGDCKTINGTRYVLVDFSHNEEERVIVRGTERLLNAGYRPILAHVERYNALRRRNPLLERLRDNGALLQINTQTLVGEWGFGMRNRCMRLLEDGLVSFVASDCHDMKNRGPGLSKAYEMIVKKTDRGYANALCMNNAAEIVHADTDGKDTD